MSTPAQRLMLFSHFAHLANANQWNGTKREQQRERITVELFGEVISWADLSNPQVDRLKARLIALRKPLHVGAQIDDANATEDGERRRLINRIEQDLAASNLPVTYVRKLAVDQYDAAEWRDLSIDKLQNLMRTLHNRTRTRSRKAKRNPPSVLCPPSSDNHPF